MLSSSPCPLHRSIRIIQHQDISHTSLEKAHTSHYADNCSSLCIYVCSLTVINNPDSLVRAFLRSSSQTHKYESDLRGALNVFALNVQKHSDASQIHSRNGFKASSSDSIQFNQESWSLSVVI